ncbi:MAG: histidinol-phosphate transaminase [Chloroflexi bacterium]|nr:histidinol-phosphate transaminase [Chloroflexota bacterium]MDA1175140.1 histidinol-phosphate transaminase [Chloroflexota bacterium]
MASSNAGRKGPLDFVRPHLLTLAPYEAVDPPDVLAKKAGMPESQTAKLNGNENPYGPSPRVAEMMAAVNRMHIYPDPAQVAMRTALGEFLGVPKDQIVVGNGSDEIIDLVFRCVLDQGDAVINCEPTFGMYEFTAHVCGGRTITIERDEHFAVDVDAVLAAVDERTKIVAIASPNNPSGNCTPLEDIERLLAADILVLMDEAYIEFGGTSVATWVARHPNLIVLRTFSKWGGLAGLRIGYGIMAAELADLLLRAKPPYNVNQASEAAMLATLSDIDTLNQRADLIVLEREKMLAALAEMPGVDPLPSEANFLLCRMPEGRGKAVYESLARQGVFVRYYSRASLADYLRISIGTPEQTTQVIEAMIQALAE